MSRAASSPRTVLITGAASGLGAAPAARRAARGDRVLVADLVEPTHLPAGAAYQRLDIASPSDWDGDLDRVQREFGRLGVLINNPGIAAGARIVCLDDTHRRRVLDFNVLGAINDCRTVAPLLKAQERGHVNVASLAGLVHPAAMSSYTASKAAIVALSESLRDELRPCGIDVTVVCPSFFRSNLASSLGGEDSMIDAAKLISRAPADADQIAQRVLKGVDVHRFLGLADRPARVTYWTKRLARPLSDRQMSALGTRIHRAEMGEESV